ncbi:hypothetical protein DTO207G8_8128 [Paecilomyces variotii]|nr:hypothetical protein DTO207G8_8128 [Paecilomyces variotii]
MALGPYRRCVSVPGVANGACANCIHFSRQSQCSLQNYLKDLGPLKAALDYCTLATACQIALEGRGPPDFQDQVIATKTIFVAAPGLTGGISMAPESKQ